jgi:uncharacterized membrane protein
MAKDNFTQQQQEAIFQAIERAESNTSGEIRVHIEHKCSSDPMERAIRVFNKLGMHKTALRNGVLIYLALKDRKLAIIGDEGINKVIPAHFWEDERDMMIDHFRRDQFTEGLVKGILMVGEQLKQFFPIAEDDKNELSNEISFGENEE